MKEIKLSESCWRLWLSVTWFVFVLIVLTTAIIGVIIWSTSGNGSAWNIIGVIVAGFLLINILILLYMRTFWKHFKVTYNEIELRVYSGVWWQKQVLIPMARITNINIIQGPWQRARKLATLKIETAGKSGTSNPETQLWSLADYETIRDEILKCVVRARTSHGEDGTAAAETEKKATVKEAIPWQSMLDLLKKIEENTRQKKN